MVTKITYTFKIEYITDTKPGIDFDLFEKISWFEEGDTFLLLGGPDDSVIWIPKYRIKMIRQQSES